MFSEMNFPQRLRAHATTLTLTVTLFGVVLTSCKKEEVTPGKEEGDAPHAAVVEMTADIVSGNEYARGPQRIHLGPDMTSDHSKVTDILWTAGDEVACWNVEEKRWAPYQLVSGANETTARFRGKAVHKNDDNEGQEALNISHAIFPLSATVRQLITHDGQDSLLISPGHMVHSIYFTMPGEQKYQAPINGNPTFGTQYNVMTGTRSPSNPSHILFRSTGGVLLLRIKGSSFLSTIYGLKLTSNREEKLWGTFTAAIGTGGESTVEVATDINGTPLASMGLGLPEGSNTLILDCSNDGVPMTLDTKNFTNFYFVVPYGVFSSGFTITMDTDGTQTTGADRFDNGTITTTKNNTIIQSDIKVMPALELTENVTLTWDLDDMYSQGTVTEL